MEQLFLSWVLIILDSMLYRPGIETHAQTSATIQSSSMDNNLCFFLFSFLLSPLSHSFHPL